MVTVLLFLFRFCDKCLKILLINSSYLNKAEELLWKRGFYDVVQRCKQHTEVFFFFFFFFFLDNWQYETELCTFFKL